MQVAAQSHVAHVAEIDDLAVAMLIPLEGRFPGTGSRALERAKLHQWFEMDDDDSDVGSGCDGDADVSLKCGALGRPPETLAGCHAPRAVG